jgi:4-amino-4-deoxy-L-arabinose transferase-like glycosyltransferase
MGRGWFFVCLFLTLCLAGLTYCSLAVYWPKFSRAEVFFAECAREMLVTQNFVTPLYHKQPFFDKPILVYWLIIAMFKVFGITHLAARVPSIVAALGTIAVTCGAGAALFSRRAGIFAGSMLATSFLFLSFAALCMSDMLLVFFDTLTLTLMYLGMRSEKRRDLLWVLSALSMGLAFLTKGPVGIVLPVLAMITFLGLTKWLKMVKPKHVIYALLIIALVASPWFIAAYFSNGSNAIMYFFLHENLQRFAGSTYDAGKPFWYTIGSLFYGFAPWSVFLPFAFLGFIHSYRNNGTNTEAAAPSKGKGRSKQAAPQTFAPTPLEGSLFLWVWLVIAVGFFCFSRGKCDYYTLPAYPAAAILAGSYLDSKWQSLIVKAILMIFAVAFLIVGGASGIVLHSMTVGTQGLWWLIPSALVVAGFVALYLSFANRPGACYALSATSICLVIILSALQIMPTVSSKVPIDKYAKLIANGASDTKIGVDKSLHSWVDEITFQTGRHPVVLNSNQEIQQFLGSTANSIILVPKNLLGAVPDSVRSTVKILSEDTVITHSLTPGFAIERLGKLTDPIPVVLGSVGAGPCPARGRSEAPPRAEKGHSIGSSAVSPLSASEVWQDGGTKR